MFFSWCFPQTCCLVPLTGAKLPDPACYGHTQFHLVPDRYHRDRMARNQQSDQVEVFLRANGLASLFAWTGAQAMYQGKLSTQQKDNRCISYYSRVGFTSSDTGQIFVVGVVSFCFCTKNRQVIFNLVNPSIYPIYCGLCKLFLIIN